MTVKVMAEAFDAGAELAQFEAAQPATVGAITSFLGKVRADNTTEGATETLTLEHYPAMAERELTALAAEARERWQLADVLIIHRYGPLALGAPIVFVATAAAHRQAAFEAAAFLMDYLKTRAPFWKKTTSSSGAAWVKARASDSAAAARWTKPKAD